MKKLAILLLVVFISGCSSLSFSAFNFLKPKAKTKKPVLTSEITTKHCELRPFETIVVGGDARVELVNGSYAMDVTGAYLNNYHCNRVKGKELHVGKIGGKASNVVVKIAASKISKVVVLDEATVSAKDFKTDNLIVVAEKRGSVNFEGAYNITKLVQRGKGRIKINWISSRSLIVKSYDSGPISLAGRVENMTAKIVNNGRLYARYLRARNASVFTTDKALAEVLVLNNLGAYAIDISSIFYYKRPEDITVVTRDSGNVLYPEWIQ